MAHLAQAVDFNKIYNNAQTHLGRSITLPGGTPLSAATLADIISALLPYIFVFSGLILFGYLVWGGFELLTSAGNPEKVKSAKDKLTAGLVGFLIIFLAWWLTQILEVIFGITILS